MVNKIHKRILNTKNKNKTHTRDIVLDTETAIQHTHNIDQDTIRHDIKRKLQHKQQYEHKQHSNEFQLLKNIKRKLQEHNLTILKADKGNINVIIEKQTLNNKIETFFNENNITKLNKDPTPNYHKQINKTLNNTKHIVSPDNIKYFKQIKAKATTLNALPKLHKPNIPIRPLINLSLIHI